MGYLENNGLIHLWLSLKQMFSEKVDKIDGKGLSTNDYTTTEKNKLAGISEKANNYTLPTASSSTLGGVKIGTNLDMSSDGTVSAKDTTYAAASASNSGLMSATDKSKLDEFEEASTYATKSEVNAKVDKVSGKGLSTNDYTTAEKTKLAAFSSADSYALKSDISKAVNYQGQVATYAALPTNASRGDMYDVTANGHNYIWNGTTWDDMGETFTIESITNAEIDAIISQ